MAITDSIKLDDCYTTKELIDELGITLSYWNVLAPKIKRSKAFPWLVKKEGGKAYFPQQVVDQIKIWREKNAPPRGAKNKKSTRNLKAAKLVIQVPVYDSDIADALRTEFETEDAMSRYLQDHIEASVKTKLAELEELEAEMARRREDIMRKKRLNMQK